MRYRKRLENERVFEFLAGLNQELDEVRGRILGRKPLPSIREIFSEVRREENRRKVMLKPKNFTGHTGTGPETSALMSKKAPNGSSQNQQKKRPWREHCRKTGHTKDTCWELYGKPPDWKPK